MSFFKEIGSVCRAISAASLDNMRGDLNKLYNQIVSYDSKFEEIEIRIRERKSRGDLDSFFTEEMTEFNKLKEQMDTFILEYEVEEKKSSNKFLDQIISEMRRLEKIIYVAIRFNTTWLPSEMIDLESIEDIDKNSIEKQLNLNENLEEVKNGSNRVLEELKVVNEYYNKARKAIGNDENKINMLEKLIDYMASEVIKKDMQKNGIVLPSNIENMRYFK